MSVPRSGGVVIDTIIFSWLTEEDDDPIADAYRALIGSRSVVLASQTVLELRYGALHGAHPQRTAASTRVSVTRATGASVTGCDRGRPRSRPRRSAEGGNDCSIAMGPTAGRRPDASN